MTISIDELSRKRQVGDMPPTAPPGARTIDSRRRAALIAGIGILLIAALAVFGDIFVVEGLVTPGDAAKTARDIMASEGMFRLGVASLYLVIVLDVIVAWALFRVFDPVSEGVSRVAAWFRLAFAGVFMVAIGQLAGIPHLLGSDGYSTAFGTEQLHAQALLKADAYQDIWMAGLVLFGVHLLLIGYLAYRSGYVPKILGVLLAVAGFGYVFDSFGAVLSERAPVISTVTFLGEFLLGIWLLVRSRRVALGSSRVVVPSRKGVPA
jgi:uncharacterized protein DUF4386